MSPRIKAFFIHLLISVCVISIFMGVVLFIWYPFPFDFFYSPFDVLKIVLSVDLVLGPLLTLVLYNVKKKTSELRMDISLVVLLQLTAFIWGAYVTYTSRPVVLVYSNGTFYMLARDELDLSQLKRKELDPKFWMPPQLAFIDPPKNAEELDKLYREYWIEGKPEITIRTDRYLPWKEGYKQSSEFAIDVGKVAKDKAKKTILDQFLEQKGRDFSTYDFYPVRGTSKTATLAICRENGEICGLIKHKL